MAKRKLDMHQYPLAIERTKFDSTRDISDIEYLSIARVINNAIDLYIASYNKIRAVPGMKFASIEQVVTDALDLHLKTLEQKNQNNNKEHDNHGTK